MFMSFIQPACELPAAKRYSLKLTLPPQAQLASSGALDQKQQPEPTDLGFVHSYIAASGKRTQHRETASEAEAEAEAEGIGAGRRHEHRSPRL